ncbi:MAG: hypothetical protein K0S14_2083 [Thermomicrobiales bacterium]|jgi:hypothetical protein|nr:hypothetical protein [Thermomicrobiales bacterium]MCE3247263.1 hypothetical protein [Geminicoccaceae bacterium]MDF2758451.1 hypothetical protein [Thermomicrobiales bacterium]MDF2969627.1 hypothetical protein [Microvirga sp.]
MQAMIDSFGLTKPAWELVLRGTVAFLALVALVRLVPKRNAGHTSSNDMLVLITIGGMGADGIMVGRGHPRRDYAVFWPWGTCLTSSRFASVPAAKILQ